MEGGSRRVTSYDPTSDRGHHLAILVGQGVVAWVAHDLRTSAPGALAWGADMAILEHATLPKHPRSVSFVSLPEWSTLVPDGALYPGDEEQHLALIHGELPAGQVRDEPVRTLGASCIYVHEELAERQVLERFPNARALPLQAVLVQSAQQRSNGRPLVLVHRGADRVDIAIAHDQELLLSNSYPARTPEDLLYFCLLAMERCGCSPEDTLLHCGGTHLTGIERDLLQRYLPHMASANPFRWPGAALHEHADRWLAAMDQLACVS
ncbi:MAG: DUF3822 family protein [Flavobacteriales bacterium]|nr:DUF3822 family protein [Flavobacteriales bacterium]MBK7101783.1 DUF3822 family protein [Flavobacteriales bacterium]MBK7114132.1 DUF3822 family protein [Flavobacteriales bacterium]MBK7483814.1 DUF3822 family protein [Flavobacteriales bacterium]MBP8878875.1 DUF3822 family protein [Flavobacteriales bacterium]